MFTFRTQKATNTMIALQKKKRINFISLVISPNRWNNIAFTIDISEITLPEMLHTN